MEYVLILGGGGFIGKNLLLELIKSNASVIIFDHIIKKEDTIYQKDRIILIEGKLTDYELLSSVFTKYDIKTVIHLISGILPASNSSDFIQELDNVLIPTVKLVDLMKEKSMAKLVFLSSGGTVYGDYKETGEYSESDELNPINYYGLSKKIMEDSIKQLCKDKRVDYMIFRPSNPFGVYQNIYGKQGVISVIIGKIIKDEKIQIWGNGENVRDYIPIKTMCKSIVSLMNRQVYNETFNIGSGIGHSINEIIHIFELIVGKKLNVEYLPSRQTDARKIVLNIDKLKANIADFRTNLEEDIREYALPLLGCEE